MLKVFGLWFFADSKFRGALPIPLGHPIIFSTKLSILSILKVVPFPQGVFVSIYQSFVGRFFWSEVVLAFFLVSSAALATRLQRGGCCKRQNTGLIALRFRSRLVLLLTSKITSGS